MAPRDAEVLRRIAKIDRAASSFLMSPEWEPHTPTIIFGVFASRWPKGDETLWTVVNRNTYAVKGAQMEVPIQAGMRFFDLWNGVELHPSLTDGRATLSFDLEANGYDAVLAAKSLAGNMEALLKDMNGLASKPLSSYSAAWEALPQQIVPIPATEPGSEGTEGMVHLPGVDFRFRVLGIEIEGKNDEGVDVQYPWETSARRYHDSTKHVNPIWIDKYPVTNRQYKAFLEATHYQPTDSHNFLKDWNNGMYPSGWANKPVTWVSIEDARAYGHWAGKRLPHEREWQYASQGNDERPYPWGSTYPENGVVDGDRPLPVVDTGGP